MTELNVEIMVNGRASSLHASHLAQHVCINSSLVLLLVEKTECRGQGLYSQQSFLNILASPYTFTSIERQGLIVWQRFCEPARLKIAYCLSISAIGSCLPSHVYRTVPTLSDSSPIGHWCQSFPFYPLVSKVMCVMTKHQCSIRVQCSKYCSMEGCASMSLYIEKGLMCF